MVFRKKFMETIIPIYLIIMLLVYTFALFIKLTFAIKDRLTFKSLMFNASQDENAKKILKSNTYQITSLSIFGTIKLLFDIYVILYFLGHIQ